MARHFYKSARPFSRLWWSESLRTLMWVALVTVLIWVYADMEFTQEREFRVTVRITARAADNRVILVDGRLAEYRPQEGAFRVDQEVAFKLKGSSTALDQYAHRLKDRNNTIEYDLSTREPETIILPAEEVINKGAEPAKSGLSLVQTMPGALRIVLDELITVPNVPVKFQFTGGELASEPVLTPDVVSVRVARSQWEKDKPAAPVIRTAPHRLTGETPAELTVRLESTIGAVQAIPSPASVKVQLKVQQLVETRAFKTFVNISMPPAWMEDGGIRNYALVRENAFDWSNLEVRLTGPKSELDALEKLPKPEGLMAWIQLNDTDRVKTRQETWTMREVIIRLPAGMNLKVAGPLPKLQFRLDPIGS
jgi:hypothetical protein